MNLISEDYLMHHGVKGMKWGVRHDPERLNPNRGDSSVTRRVKADYNNMSNDQFRAKYQTSKHTYAKRVAKYGDPYMHRKNSTSYKVLNKMFGKNSKYYNSSLAKKQRENLTNKFQSKDEKRANRNSKIINREIEYQKRKIADYEKKATAYESSAKEVRKSGVSELVKQGYSIKDAKKATNLVASRRETEAKWNRHLAKHYADYNKRLSEIDVSKMSRRQTWAVIQDLGNKKVSEVNSTWKEPESTKEYNKAKYGR